jgi:hypothetical protein
VDCVSSDQRPAFMIGESTDEDRVMSLEDQME